MDFLTLPHISQESAENKIDLPEDEPDTVKVLIQYLYEGEYDPKLPDGKLSSDVVDPVAPVVSGPKKDGFHYRFPHTCARGCRSYHNVCPHHSCSTQCADDCVDFICKECCIPTVLPAADGGPIQLLLHAKMYEIGDKYDVVGLKQLAREKFIRACTRYWDSKHFGPAVHHAFNTTPDEDQGLREVVNSVVAQHIELLNKPEIEILAKELNGFAFGLLKARAADLGWAQ